MLRNYWLFKSEPTAYSFDDLVRDGVSEWDGVRNFEARNHLRDKIAPGDGVLFYHSNTKEPSVVGTAIVVRGGYPDHTAWQTTSDHPDPRSTPSSPIWYMVDIKAEQRLVRPVTLGMMKKTNQLASMVLLHRGRLSVQPVTETEWNAIIELGLA